MFHLFCAFILSPFVVVPTPAQPASAGYTIVNLGKRLNPLAIGPSSVVGMTPKASAFLLRDGVFFDLGATSGCQWSIAWDGNSAGAIVGECAASAADWQHAVLWKNGTMQDLGTLGGSSSRAYGINELGSVVGTAVTASNESHAFLWRQGVMLDLGGLPGAELSQAWKVNRSDEVIGSSFSQAKKFQAFLWKGGNLFELPGHGLQVFANGINDRGQIVGAAEIAPNVFQAARWEYGTLIDIHPVGFDESIAQDINEDGFMVGSAGFGNPFGILREDAILWRNGVAENLNSLIPAGSGWHLIAAYRISEDGKILGVGKIHGELVNYLLIP